MSDLEATRRFYVDVLGAREGRSTDRWVDFDFGGHQISAHRAAPPRDNTLSEVDGKPVPLQHFGLILPWNEWEALAQRIQRHGVSFELAPQIRFQGSAEEQGTFFARDPSGNALEFKAFRRPEAIFGRSV